jgi:hypothetical protein
VLRVSRVYGTDLGDAARQIAGLARKCHCMPDVPRSDIQSVDATKEKGKSREAHKIFTTSKCKTKRGRYPPRE